MVTSNRMSNGLPKGIYFDMDNTLFDFVEAKLIACECMIDHMGSGDPEDLLNYFLRGKYHFEHLSNIKEYIEDQGIYSDDLFIQCCDIYQSTTLDNIKLYPNVMDTLELLKKKNISVAIVTDAYKQNAARRLKKAGICHLIDKLITRDVSGAKKPELEVFYYALNEFKYSPNEVVFVGDSMRRDIAPAKQIGMITAHALYGDKNRNYGISLKPDHVLKDIKDILQIIDSSDHHNC